MPQLKKAVKEFLGDVPAHDQVTLLGFNDSVFASVMRPPLTVIGRPLDEISRLVCRLVTSRLLDPQRPARIEVVNMQLMIRGSSAAPAAGAVR